MLTTSFLNKTFVYLHDIT